MTALDAPVVLASAPRAVRQFVAFIETGDVPEGLFTDDVFCDFTMPQWRLQAVGPEQVQGARRAGHPGPSTVVRMRLDSIPGGFLLEFEERWEWDGQRWYARELVRADVRDTSIAQLSVYCTGDWDEATVARHAEEVTLIRP